jgi:putative MFS transporter
MMVTVAGFTIFTGLTALARDAWEFTVCQLLARIFLTAEYALAIIMVGEEFPARWRGRAIAVLTSLATVGVVAMAKLHPFLLLEDGAPGNALHDAGQAAVAWLQTLVGRPVDGASWRVLYLYGVAPLALIAVLRIGMRETRRFEAVRAELHEQSEGAKGAGLRSVPHTRITAAGTERFQGASEGPEGAEARSEAKSAEPNEAHKARGGPGKWWESALIPWRPEYRRRTAIVALLWNCVYMVTSPAVAYWVIYAREDLQFSAHTVGDVIFWAYVAGVGGHVAAGWAIDRFGRKRTCAATYVVAAVTLIGLFHTQTMVGQYVWHIATVFCFLAATTATHVYASELFPTEIRATGYGWASNLFGRITEIGTPLLVGLYVDSIGIPWAVTTVAFGPILGALLVLRYAPETKGLTLEQIQEALAPRLTPKRVTGAAEVPAAGG